MKTWLKQWRCKRRRHDWLLIVDMSSGVTRCDKCGWTDEIKQFRRPMWVSESQIRMYRESLGKYIVLDLNMARNETLVAPKSWSRFVWIWRAKHWFRWRHWSMTWRFVIYAKRHNWLYISEGERFMWRYLPEYIRNRRRARHGQ